MIPIKQKNIYNHEKGIIGDCLRACICSLLEIDDTDVYNFAEDEDYPMELIKFLKDRGYRMRYSKIEPKDIVKYYMVWGISPRGLNHSVIYSDGKLVHDPHPYGGGVVPDMYAWLEKRKMFKD